MLIYIHIYIYIYIYTYIYIYIYNEEALINGYLNVTEVLGENICSKWVYFKFGNSFFRKIRILHSYHMIALNT